MLIEEDWREPLSRRYDGLGLSSFVAELPIMCEFEMYDLDSQPCQISFGLEV